MPEILLAVLIVATALILIFSKPAAGDSLIIAALGVLAVLGFLLGSAIT